MLEKPNLHEKVAVATTTADGSARSIAKKIVLLAILLMMTMSAFAQTYVGGPVGGYWDRGSSPYIVQRDIEVRSGDRLEIEPGVEVLFYPDTRFTVNGQFSARGYDRAMISFRAYNPRRFWKGIWVEDTEDCIFDYTHIADVANSEPIAFYRTRRNIS